MVRTLYTLIRWNNGKDLLDADSMKAMERTHYTLIECNNGKDSLHSDRVEQWEGPFTF